MWHDCLLGENSKTKNKNYIFKPQEEEFSDHEVEDFVIETVGEELEENYETDDDERSISSFGFEICQVSFYFFSSSVLFLPCFSTLIAPISLSAFI